MGVARQQWRGGDRKASAWSGPQGNGRRGKAGLGKAGPGSARRAWPQNGAAITRRAVRSLAYKHSTCDLLALCG